MIVRDWRNADAALLRACYAREQRAWQHDLSWDTTWTWATVEQARVSWGLPGLLAFDEDGAVQGWAFCMPENGRQHVGGLVASSPVATCALLDGILERQAADTEISCFIRNRAPGLIHALAARGFDVERFQYLSRPLTGADAGHASAVAAGNAWADTDFPGAAALLKASYSPDAGRHFAPTGTVAEWVRYLSGVVHQAGCGHLDRLATRVSRDEYGLQALALITSISGTTAHLAQLAVHPDARGCGVAMRLLREALSCAAQEGRSAMTLLVGEHNETARRLYMSLGFSERAMFVAASRVRATSTSRHPAAASDREFLSQPVC
jgi:ribosomal protein S18 acetylase RimI-like enzyme